MLPDALSTAISAAQSIPQDPPSPDLADLDVPAPSNSLDNTLPPPRSPFTGNDVFGLGGHHVDFLNNAQDIAGTRNALDYGFENNITGDDLVKAAANGHFDKDQPFAGPAPYAGLQLDNTGYNPLQAQLLAENASRPAIPAYGPAAAPNWAQIGMGALGAVLDPRHAAENVGTVFDATRAARDLRYQHDLQAYQMAETQRQQSIATLEQLAGLQTHRDTSQLSANEAGVRYATEAERYRAQFAGQDMRALRVGFDNAKDPGTATATARELADRYPQYAPTKDELAAKITAMSKDAVRALQQYEQAAWTKAGPNGLEPGDQVAIQQYRQGIADTYYNGDASKLPPMLTSETVSQANLAARTQHWDQLLAHSNDVLDFGKQKFAEGEAFREKRWSQQLAVQEQHLDLQRQQVQIAAQRASTYRDAISQQEYANEIRKYAILASSYNHSLDLAARDKTGPSIARQLAGYGAMLQNGNLPDDQKKQVQAKLAQLQGEQQYLDASHKDVPDEATIQAAIGAPPVAPAPQPQGGVPFSGAISSTPGGTTTAVPAAPARAGGNTHAPVSPVVPAGLPGTFGSGAFNAAANAAAGAVQPQRLVKVDPQMLAVMSQIPRPQLMAYAHEAIMQGRNAAAVWDVLNQLGIPGHP
jgi:hypothetical protein